MRLREILANGWGCKETSVKSLVSVILDIPVEDLEQQEEEMEFRNQKFLALKEEDGTIIVNLGQTDGDDDDLVYFASNRNDVGDDQRSAGNTDVLASAAEINQWFKEYCS